MCLCHNIFKNSLSLLLKYRCMTEEIKTNIDMRYQEVLNQYQLGNSWILEFCSLCVLFFELMEVKLNIKFQSNIYIIKRATYIDTILPSSRDL